MPSQYDADADELRDAARAHAPEGVRTLVQLANDPSSTDELVQTLPLP